MVQLAMLALGIGSWSLTLLLLVSALGKLRIGPARFAATLRGTFGVPRRSAMPLALIVPMAEGGLGVTIIVEQTRALSLTVAAVFFFAMALVASSAVARGLRGRCDCYGDLTDDQLGPATWMRAGALGLLAAFLAMLSLVVSAPRVGLAPPTPWDGLVLVAAIVLISALTRGTWRLLSARGGV